MGLHNFYLRVCVCSGYCVGVLIHMRKSAHGLFKVHVRVFMCVWPPYALESCLVIALIHSTDGGRTDVGLSKRRPHCLSHCVYHFQICSAETADGRPLISYGVQLRGTKVTESDELIIIYLIPELQYLRDMLSNDKAGFQGSFVIAEWIILNTDITWLWQYSVSAFDYTPPVHPLPPPSLATIDLLCVWQGPGPCEKRGDISWEQCSARTPSFLPAAPQYFMHFTQAARGMPTESEFTFPSRMFSWAHWWSSPNLNAKK